MFICCWKRNIYKQPGSMLQEYTVKPDPLNVNWSRLNLFNHSVFWLEMSPVGMSLGCVQSRHECNTPQPAFSAVKTKLCREHFGHNRSRFFKFHFTLYNYPYVMKNISIMTLCRSFTGEWIKCQWMLHIRDAQLFHKSFTQLITWLTGPAGN